MSAPRPSPIRGAVLALAAVVLALLALPSPAEAAPACRPLDEAALRGLVSDGVDAVQRGDPEAQRALTDEILSRVPCLEFAPSARLWSDVLVLVAISRYLDDAPWQPALGAALRLRPRVQRHVGRAHPIHRFTAPPLPDDAGTPLPAGVEAYVDGERATRAPPGDVLHLVQVRQGDRWRSRLLLPGEVLEEAFLTEPIRLPLATRWWGSVSLGTSVTALHQRVRRDVGPPSAGAEEYYPDLDRPWLGPNLVLRGTASRGRLAASVALDLGLLGFSQPVGNAGELTVGWGSPTTRVGLGVATTGLLAQDLDGLRALSAWVGLLSVQHADPVTDWSIAAGTSFPDVVFGHGDVWYASGSWGHMVQALASGPLPVRWGLSANVRYAPLQAFEDTRVDAVNWRVVLEIGLAAPPPAR